MMKHILLLLSFTALLSCSKKNDLEYYLPQVEMVSAQVLPNGQMEFVGRLISDGNGDIEYLGFCADTIATPRVYENQVLVDELDNNTFTAVFESPFLLNSEGPIYVNAFATGVYAFAEAKAIPLNKTGRIYFPAPCEQDSMSIKIYSTQNIEFIDPVVNAGIGKTFNIGYGNVTIAFGFLELHAGIYEISETGINQLTNNQMSINVNFGDPYGYNIYTGQEVYVSAYNDNLYEVELCNASFNSGPNLFTRFTIESP